MTNYAALWRARWRLLRPGNAAMAAVGVLVGVVLATPGDLLIDEDVRARFVAGSAAALAAFLLTAFGNVLNDLRDVRIDREVHPDRPLPAGDISMGQAQAFAALLLGFGLWEAWVAAGVRTLAFAAANTGLLVLYELRLKRLGLVGNVTVGALVASTFCFGAFAVEPAWRDWGAVWSLAAMALLVNVARELLKDIQDLEGDREDRRTFPMRAGRPLTLVLAFLLVNVAVALSVAAFIGSPWSAWWGLPLFAADGAFIVAAAYGWIDVRAAQGGLKGAMLLALLAFLAGPLL